MRILKEKTLPNGSLMLEEYAIPKQDGWDPCRVVLCWLPDNNGTPFVTWVQNLRNGGCSWGHYHPTLLEAAQDFEERCKRYYLESETDNVQSA